MAVRLRISLPSVSLAAKCRTLFGAAVVLIVAAALTVPWLRMTDLVHEKNLSIARQMALVAVRRCPPLSGDAETRRSIAISRQRVLDDWWANEAASLGLPEPAPRLVVIDSPHDMPPLGDHYVRNCIKLLARRPGMQAAPPRVTRDSAGRYLYQVVMPVRADAEGPTDAPLTAVIVAEYAAPRAAVDLLENMGIVLMAGMLAGILAVLVFYIITQKLILHPVRELRAVADEVSAGHHDVRSTIATGDEYEDLARAFNAMLAHLEQQQEELRTINRSLDTRVGELAEHNVALFEANKIKSQFIANVSHELRTPLTSIIGFAELLREGTTDPQRASRYTENILNSGRLLLGIINDLLDLAKIETGKLTLHRGPVNLLEMATNLIDFMQPLAAKAGVTLVRDVPDDTPTMHSDSGRIQQILYNLLSNAVKFTNPGGQVVLHIAPHPPEHILLCVRDSGIGIPESEQVHIFEKFWQHDGSVTRTKGGTGLGLAITKELVQILGGAITVRSREGEGSEFRVILPCVAPESTTMPAMSLT